MPVITHSRAMDEALGARCFFAQEVKLKAHSDARFPIPAHVSAWLGCNTAAELGALWQGQGKRD